MAKDITVTMTQEEFDMLEENFGNGATEEYLGKLLANKIMRRVDQSILDLTPYNPKKLNGMTAKLEKLIGITLPVRDDSIVA